MADIISLLILFIGVLIGATAGGIVAHTMNYVSEIDGTLHSAILAVYVLVLSIGLTIEYGHPALITTTSYLGIVILGERIFELAKTQLPQ